MNRFLATLAVACLGLYVLASVATAQTQSTSSAVFEIVWPFLVEVASVFVSVDRDAQGEHRRDGFHRRSRAGLTS